MSYIHSRIKSDDNLGRANIPRKEANKAERETLCSRGDRAAEMVVFTIFRNTVRARPPPDTIAASARHSFYGQMEEIPAKETEREVTQKPRRAKMLRFKVWQGIIHLKLKTS